MPPSLALVCTVVLFFAFVRYYCSTQHFCVCVFVCWLVGLTGYLLFGPISYYIYCTEHTSTKKREGGQQAHSTHPKLSCKSSDGGFHFLARAFAVSYLPCMHALFWLIRMTSHWNSHGACMQCRMTSCIAMLVGRIRRSRLRISK